MTDIPPPNPNVEEPTEEHKDFGDGRTWSRWLGVQPAHFYYADDETIAPAVRCPCGSTTFTLVYGHYEIRAKCTRCETEECVYDG